MNAEISAPANAGLLQKSLALIAGFSLGQGSVFLVNAWLLWQGDRSQAGVLVALIACFSFSYLFSDLANPTKVAQLVAERSWAGLSDFFDGRAAIGGACSAVLSFALMVQVVAPAQALGFAAAFAMSAVIYGRTSAVFVERQGAYWTLGLLQAAPWVVLSAVMLAAFRLGDARAGVAVLAVSQPAIALLYRVLVRSAAVQPPLPQWRELANRIAAKGSATLPFLVSQLLGQVWGRMIVLFLAAVHGAAFLGEFGLFRQIEVAVVLVFGFALRPRMARIAAQRDHIASAVNEQALKVLVPAFLFSILAVVVALGARWQFAEENLPLWAEWLPLLSGVFLAVVGLCFSQACQLVSSGASMLRTEAAGQALNMTLFGALVFYSPLGAILIAEGAHSLVYRIQWRRKAT